MLNAYKEGLESLRYDFMITHDGGYTYYWMRIIARIFFWEEDKSVRMLVYRQNIDSEKRRERLMTERMQRDFLSGLYNKAATQELTRRLLREKPNHCYAFFIIDIDNFKTVNDTCGHAVGDKVIADFSRKSNANSGKRMWWAELAEMNLSYLFQALLWCGQNKRQHCSQEHFITNFWPMTKGSGFPRVSVSQFRLKQV